MIASQSEEMTLNKTTTLKPTIMNQTLLPASEGPKTVNLTNSST
jgi:hypothetical protein